MTLLRTAQIITDSLRLDGPVLRLPGSVDWSRLAHHADGHSLTPLLYDTWRQAGLLGQIPPDICRRLARAYTDNAARNQHIRAELLEIHQILTQAGVPHLVLKGWPLVEQLYADPAQRVLYDHDFLVPPEQAEAGHQALKAAGFRPLPGKDEWVEKHLTPLWRNDEYAWDGYLFDPLYPRPVELHVSLWETGWRGLRVNPLPNPWANARPATVAGAPVSLLSPEDTLLHLAMHFAGHLIEREARLNQLLDLARFGQQAGPALQWEQIVESAAATHTGRFVYASLYLAQQIFGAPLPPEDVWRRLSQAAPSAFKNWLARHGPADVLTSDYRRVEKGKDYQLTFLAAGSLTERVGIMRFAALPPVEQLMKKYQFRWRWLGPIYYSRHVVERVGLYGRSVWQRRGQG